VPMLRCLTVSLSGRPPGLDKRREQILAYCARVAAHLMRHGRSKRC
jgi:hypothetical protein